MIKKLWRNVFNLGLLVPVASSLDASPVLVNEESSFSSPTPRRAPGGKQAIEPMFSPFAAPIKCLKRKPPQKRKRKRIGGSDLDSDPDWMPRPKRHAAHDDMACEDRYGSSRSPS